jgi:hypothetical protein
MTSAAPTAEVGRAAPGPGRFLAIGFAAGLIGGAFGVGGGLVIVPCLLTFAAFDRRLAHGTSLAATLPIAVASLVTYVANGNVDWPAAGFLAVGSTFGAVVGIRLLHVLPKRVITLVFIAATLATAARLLIGTDSTGRADLTVGGAAALVAIGVVAGVLAGLLGIGGGIIMGPALVVGYGELAVVAKGTSAAVIVPTALMGTFRNRSNDNVDLRAAGLVGLTGAVAAVAGGTIADRLSPTASDVTFALLLLVVAITQALTLRTPGDAPVAPVLASRHPEAGHG